ncbi:toll/interleukin-1 receptor domain-containing protein [Sulfuricurvum sp.]|uniref:toll/interleukin-1 receptor domain-containing protein n=1 Tax=Sulfuricurvum sp. TaxID=2025608 RepID=UPI002625941B|nr:toll/interleukin-1 receptor domain-containing protein [Sulfuricurvum sp.]MDD3594815.1 toll/interleukin-1 receptor domain-containing protein [Sulfuricurvum sp.]
MPIFISYSHSDKEFVDQFAAQLVKHHVNVWLDRWELNLGDSIIDKVQEAIEGSSALLVILSKASIESEWCKKEISSAFLKELEEKRVFVLPVLLEDCDIPLFARGKLYADFRTSFDAGLTVVLEGIAKITNPNLARFKEHEYHVDHSLDWGETENDITFIRLTYVEQAKGQPYTCLTEIIVYIEDEAKELYDLLDKKNEGEKARFCVIEALHQHFERSGDFRPILADAMETSYFFEFHGQNAEKYIARVGVRRLGEDTGRDIIMFTNNLVKRTYLQQKEVLNNL